MMVEPSMEIVDSSEDLWQWQLIVEIDDVSGKIVSTYKW